MELPNSEVCSICLEDLIENIKITKCSGQKCKFHNDCYNKYIDECNKHFRNKSCPLCREILEKRSANYLNDSIDFIIRNTIIYSEELSQEYETLIRSEELPNENIDDRIYQIIRTFSSTENNRYNSPISIERPNVCPPAPRLRRVRRVRRILQES